MDVRLPKLGEGVDSGSVVTVFVKEGDTVSPGQTILELENEKAVAPIPSPAGGKVVALRVKAGDKLNVGQVILSLNEAGAESKAASTPAIEPSPKREPARPAAAPTPVPTTAERAAPLEPATDWSATRAAKAGFPPPAAPSLRRLAKELGIDLTRVRGTQAGGRIVMEDLRAYIQHLQHAAFGQKKEQVQTPTAAESVDFAQWGPVSSKPLSSLRQVISRRMVESWSTIPHVTQFDEADITRLNDLRKKHAPRFEAQGARLTVTSFVVKGVVAVLKKHPIFNASLDERAQAVVFKQYYHIGLAVDTEAGLVVPVLRDVDSKNLLQLSKELQELSEKARTRKLSLDEMKGGTFTISNQGGIGSSFFTPIINRPEVAILGLGRGAPKALVIDGQVQARLTLPLALSYDHRLIDGANAARFMVDLVAALEGMSDQDAQL